MQDTILPGKTIGFSGGGQLGQMGAMAARAMGYKVVVLDPDANCSAAGVVDQVIVGSFDDPQAARKLGELADVISYEIEKIGPDALAAAGEHAQMRPSPAILHMVQDRSRQKAWLAEHRFPIGPCGHVFDAASLAAAVAEVGTPARLKTCHGGYDGRGQASVPTPEGATDAWKSVDHVRCTLEKELTLLSEFSVMVARRPNGEMRLFPAARNWHDAGVLKWSVIPADLPDAVVAEGCTIAERLASTLGLEGLLAVEFFHTAEHGVTINEMAARPHNTFHATQLNCAVSQFEQWVRAICDLPLAATAMHRPTALGNLLGDLWEKKPPNFAGALAVPEAQIRLYSKAPRKSRKMGHVMAGGDSPAAALATVQAAYAALCTPS